MTAAMKALTTTLLILACAPTARAEVPDAIAGTWTLVAADVIRPDGRREADYGASPKGLLMIDRDGRYSLQIYSAERPRFAAGDKLKGTAREYEAAVLGASNHFGRIMVDEAAHRVTLVLENSSYPNQEGTTQIRTYELKDNVLSYRVPPRPDGSVPVSVWKKD